MNHKMKDVCRRIIRGLMLAIAVFLLTAALAVPIANNAIAYGMEKELLALPLPEGATVVSSVSVAGKLIGNGNGMQYFAAVLLESDRPLAELQEHFAAYAEKNDRPYLVVRQEGERIAAVENQTLTFRKTAENGYVLYFYDNSRRPMQGWLDLDLRGH